jgi:multidrug transporter EmrE-like cation transporter
MKIIAILFCFLYALLNVSGAAIIKWNLKGRVLSSFNDWFQFLMHVQVIGAFVVIFASALVMFKALSTAPFTFVIPVSAGINFILTIIAGYYIFRDQLNMLSFVGFTLIISGIILLSLNTPSHAQ